MSPLTELGQSDFGAGSQLEVAPHLISPTGFHDVENGLLWDDGSVYKRGGSVLMGAAAFGGEGAKGKFIWEGEMSVGRRTVVANGADFGVASKDGKESTLINLGGGGFSGVPGSAVFFQHILWIGGGTLYGGSRKAADYGAGTIALTQGSAIVKGSGTAWAANVDPGMILNTITRAYVVKEVLNDTEVVLYDAYEGGSAGGLAYLFGRLLTAGASNPYLSRPYYAVAGERLVGLQERRVDFSEPNKPHLYQATIFPQETVVQNFHELPEADKILGAATIGVDKLLVFHTGGITTISNMAKSIVDGLGNSQHRIDIYSRDVVLWGDDQGIASSATTFIVPAIDNVYLLDGVSAPVRLADAIIPRLRERLLEGYVPGGAWVAREHYFLPILDSAGEPVELCVCRLDKPYQFRNKTLYPWSFLTGAGARIAYGTTRHPKVAGETPRVMAMAADSNLVDLLPFFFPDETNAYDHDGTVPTWSILTKDWGIGNEGITRWRKLQMFYELWPLAGTAPVISAELGTGVSEEGLPLWDEVEWDEFDWASAGLGEFAPLEGTAPANSGLAGRLAQNEKVWYSNARARYVRYRLTSADPVAKLVLRGILIFPAQTGGIRHSRVN